VSAVLPYGDAGSMAHCSRHTVGTAVHRHSSHWRGRTLAVGSSSCRTGAVLGPLAGSGATTALPSLPDAKVLRHRNSRPIVLTDTHCSWEEGVGRQLGGLFHPNRGDHTYSSSALPASCRNT